MPGAPSSPEWIALVAGLKPGLRSWSEAARAAAQAATARARGFAVEEVAVPGGARVITYVAGTPAAARALRDLEASILPGQPPRPMTPAALGAHRGLGLALGYPPCCVDAFVERVARGVTVLPASTPGVAIAHAHEDFVAAATAAARSAALEPACNVFAADRTPGWIAHVPCRFDCAASIAIARQVRAAYRRHDRAAVAALDHRLAQDVAIGRDGRRTALTGAAADACRLAFSAAAGPTGDANDLDPAGCQPVR